MRSSYEKSHVEILVVVEKTKNYSRPGRSGDRDEYQGAMCSDNQAGGKTQLDCPEKKVLKILGQLDKDGEVDSDEMASSQQKRIKLM